MKYRALFSLDDTTDVAYFAMKLIDKGWEIIASQETTEILQKANVPVTPLEFFLGVHEKYPFPPTLHPKIEEALTFDCPHRIDMVYCIPYGPEKGNDVGGRTLLALAQKGKRIAINNVNGMRRFVHMRQLLNGENPYQEASMDCLDLDDPLAIPLFEQVAGEDPCFTNIADLDNVLQTLILLFKNLDKHNISVAAKHGNACGVGLENIENALKGNQRAIWGGEFITNQTIGINEAIILSDKIWMLDVVAAPEIEPNALEMLAKRERRKVFVNKALTYPTVRKDNPIRFIRGGVLSQSPGNYVLATTNKDLAIACAVAYSSFHGGNEVALAKDGMLIGVGGGPSTIEAVQTAIERAKANGHDVKGAAFCADAFFPFTDAPELLVKAGCKYGAVPLGGVHEAEVKAVLEGVDMHYIPAEFRGFYRH